MFRFPPPSLMPCLPRHLGALLLVPLLALLPAFAADVKPFKADYQATFMGLQAPAHMSLTASDNTEAPRWTYRLELSGAGARLIQSTVFEIDGEHWRPLASQDSQRGESGLAALLVKNRSTESVWDWQHRQVRWTGDLPPERSAPVALQPGDLDAMLLNLVLVRDVAARKPLTYRLVDEGRAREQRFRRVGTEEISVDGQSYRALKVIREDGNRSITVWVVENLPVPARILQQRNGKDHIDLRLSGLQALP